MLTNREVEVLNLVIDGMNNRQIAENLFITEHTVKAHLEHIFSKYQVHSKIELIIKLSKSGMI